MQKVNIDVVKIALRGFSLKNKKFNVRVDYLANHEPKSFEREYLMFNGEELAKRVINNIKAREEREDNSDDFSNVTIFEFNDHEKKEEKIVHFFNKLHDELKSFRTRGTSDGYLNDFHELSRKFIEL